MITIRRYRKECEGNFEERRKGAEGQDGKRKDRGSRPPKEENELISPRLRFGARRTNGGNADEWYQGCGRRDQAAPNDRITTRPKEQIE